MGQSRKPALAGVQPFDEAALSRALANGWVEATEIAARDQAKYLAGYLKAIGAATLVVEHPYVDGDYLDDFAAYYVLCFPHYERWCKRVHFFSTVFSEKDLVQALLDENDVRSKLRESYLGFIVARPLPEALIGRTVLKTYPNDGGRRHYPSTRTYDVNLFGLELRVESLPYQEQDTVMAACATVSLWSALHKAHDLFKTPAPRPAVITRSANKVIHPGRPIPTHGLNVRQMCKAISDVGLEPEVFEVTVNTPLSALLYGHVRAGLPVVLGVDVEGSGLHAVTVCGYSLLPDEHLTVDVDSVGTGLPMVSRRINEFYAHDDQIGPFCRMCVNPPITLSSGDGRAFPMYFDKSWRQGQNFVRLFPVVAIVPVYHKIRVTLLEIRTWLLRLDWLLGVVIGKDVNREWDLYLTTTGRLKRSLTTTRSTLPEAAKQELLLVPQPKYIWRAALSVNNAPVLEVWADATDTARSLPIFRALWIADTYRKRCRALLDVDSLQEKLKAQLTRRLWDLLKNDT